MANADEVVHAVKGVPPSADPQIERLLAASGTQKVVRIALIGAGNRGWAYAQFAAEHPDRAVIVAVAEPRKWRRENVWQAAKASGAAEPLLFDDWKDLAAAAVEFDCVIVAVQDAMHCEVAMPFLLRGIHTLCEKPMATTPADCSRMVAAARASGAMLAVCHVLRYTPYTQHIKKIIDSGVIGKVTCVQHLEPIGYYHFAHSYVRGNWRRRDHGTFILMAKSCHDIDWLQYIIGSRITRVSSFGSLHHFNKESKPVAAAGATKCLDCPINKSCAYSATEIYLERIKRGHTRWPVNVIVDTPPDIENITEALNTGPYGRCVYECDNSEPDNQVVNMEFKSADGNVSTASFTMAAFSTEICERKTRIFGTLGQLECNGKHIEHRDFASSITEVIQPVILGADDTALSGHDGADWFLMNRFIAAVAHSDPHLILSGADASLESHMAIFAAEEARIEGKVLTLDEYLGRFQAD